jgi:hypothetical protein
VNAGSVCFGSSRRDVDGPDVVRELTVSLRRMRTQTRSIFNKLRGE